MQKTQKFILLGWILLAPFFTLQAQDGHSLKLGYMASRGPTHYFSLGYEGEISPRFSFAPTLGFSSSNGSFTDGQTIYNVSGFSQAVVLPIRYYPWYSQPDIKAGPFVSSHIQYQYAKVNISNILTASAQFLGWGIGGGWKAGVGRFTLEGYFNLAVLGRTAGTVVAFDTQPYIIEIVKFPAIDFSTGISAGIRL